MRSTRLLTMLVSLAMLGLPALVLTAGPASAIETWATRVVIDRAPAKQVYGHDVKVSGVLQAQRPTDGAWLTVDGQTLHLEQQKAGAAGFTEVDSQVSDATGAVEFVIPAKVSSKLRIRYDGGTYPDPQLTLTASMSEAKKSKVMRDLGAREPKDGGRIVFKGNVNPGYGGKVVFLQRKTCKSCTWKAFDKTRTAGNGAWSFVVPAPRTGSWYFRAKASESTKFVTSYSPVLRTFRL